MFSFLGQTEGNIANMVIVLNYMYFVSGLKLNLQNSSLCRLVVDFIYVTRYVKITCFSSGKTSFHVLEYSSRVKYGQAARMVSSCGQIPKKNCRNRKLKLFPGVVYRCSSHLFFALLEFIYTIIFNFDLSKKHWILIEPCYFRVAKLGQ